ncbi:MAG: PEP/pyruvate-binding domain-containing protein [Anaerolineales bacterium]|nr:PEP/pyruvate-binding domain-containing protein [Anaerolineales bacterium]
MTTYTLPLADPAADLITAGGKGVSLAWLARAGLPVPDGFHVTTQAYRRFVSANHLQPGIQSALQGVDPARPATLEAASQAIARLFTQATIPGELANAIVSAYAGLPGANPPVAVRSSATAEDLPEASFAGQQETYLNISGAADVLEAARRCWASLWTARAIAYRLRQNVPAEGVALAVVVQLLVDAEAAGILFTANPLNARRDEIVINAAWGLGEAVVGGAVTPDTLTLDKVTGKVIQRQTAAKLAMTVRLGSGTQERPVPESLRNVPVLSDAQAAELARLALRIETLYGQPMDVEWALADGRFAIVQARPITALGEAPLEWKPPRPKGVYMRTSVVDLMPDPVSPLFATLGIPALTDQMYPLGKMLTHMQPSLPVDYYTIINGYAYLGAGFSFRNWIWLIFGLLPAYPRLLRQMLPFWRDEAHPQYQQAVAARRDLDLQAMTNAELWAEIKALVDISAYYTCALMFATMGASAGSEGLLTRLYEKMARREGDPPAQALLMGWDNLPIRAEKSLYDLAGFCSERPSLAAHLLATPSPALADELEGHYTPAEVEPEVWDSFRRRFADHMDRFGHMVFELDYAKPLPRDHPEPALEAIKMYLRGEGADPYERQRLNEARRIETTQRALGRLKGLRRWIFTKSLNWGQSLAEVREDALADIGLAYPFIRHMLTVLGERLTAAGALPEAGDIYWLEKDEIEAAVAALERGEALESKQAHVVERKAFWQKAKRSTPPPMLPPRKKYLGINTTVWLAEAEAGQAGDTLKGVPASPGKVTAPACVLDGPEDFAKMRHGNVLVAGTTTPAWTPLFAMAAAVVTDIGGPLSHGSIVAREYGIPAVMGTGVATRRIRPGQPVTVDGSAGLVTLHPVEDAGPARRAMPLGQGT